MSNIALGTNNITNLYLGTNPVNSVYLGTNLVWGNYILNLYGSADHAYSLRRLSGSYSGACLRVRRTTTLPTVTTTTVDVSFDSNNVVSLNSPISNQIGTVTTATTLGQFAQGTVDGFTASVINVVTWYDQSGNGKNTIQTTLTRQPRLIKADGNFETSGGKVAVRFTRASSQFLNIVDTTANISNMSSYWVGQFSGISGSQIGYLWSDRSPSGRFYFPFNSSGNIYASYSNTTTTFLFNALSSDRKLYEMLAPSPSDSGLVRVFNNGVINAGGVSVGSGQSTEIQIGTGATNYFDGFIQEIIGYQSNANREQKETNINDYWTIF